MFLGRLIDYVLAMLGVGQVAFWSSTTSASTKEGLPGQDTHDDFKPQVTAAEYVWLLH